ncbi:CorA family divalent cation transporter [Flammeovirgaceae bacterium SG7u.111]|nr:CorA family divalent cation transporter [Flammeovirgaceae bacterium SG7u.132]WPO36045.1 CorA family divalent cation transporter [Flammeovirgaceae bacterium SG7u.111]
METTAYLITSEGLSPQAFSGNIEELDKEKAYWLDIKLNNRSVAERHLQHFGFSNRVMKFIEEPVRSTRINFYDEVMIMNLIISDSTDIYEPEYFTTLVKGNLILTIMKETSNVFEELEEEIENNVFEFDFNLNHLLYYMITEVLHQGMDNLLVTRKRVKKMAQLVDDDPGEVPLTEITNCKHEISQLTNIVEDQYNMLGFIPRFDWSSDATTVRKEIMELVRGFGHLFNAYERLEEKVETIQAQYQLSLQERGNKRLNTLTVVQAIFVPLTLIAGIYGMNFAIMPELQWDYGYFYVLALMVAIAVGELLWFYKKGWFD